MKQSLTKRFLKYIICVILVSNIVLFGVSYYTTYQTMKRQILSSNQNLMESQIVLLNRYFQEIDNIANSIIYNPDVAEVLKNKQDTYAGMQLLQTLERLYFHSREDLTLMFYKTNTPQNTYSIYKGSGSTEWGDFRDSAWYQEIERTGADRVIVTNQHSETAEDSDNFVHSMVYRIYDTYSVDTVGYLRIDMDLKNLTQYFAPGYENIEGTSILDEDNEVVFSDKEAVFVPKEYFSNLTKRVGYYESEDQFITYGIAKNVGWRIAFSVSKDKMFSNLNQIALIFWGTLLVVVCVTISVSGKLFTVVTENFKRLVSGITQVKEGNLSTQVEVEKQDEIGELIVQFNEMVCRTRELVTKVEKNQILLNQAEIKALQQQINPHFIFNILETIMGLASEGMDDEVITVCQHMSSMLRYNITFQNHTCLENEITQMKNYVEMLKIRFEDQFEVFYDIDEECLSGKIVKFTLQPLVENAINHGLRETVFGGMIRIRIKMEGSDVAISIYDNGCGIEEKKLVELNQKIHETIENPLDYIDQYKSLGLMNVNLRLRLFFEENYHIEIFSREKKGTCIYIKFPYQV